MYTVTTPIQVRYQETDQMGVVYHANYLVWLEIGRTEFIHGLGLSYKKMEEEGVVSPVTHVDLHYKVPVRYGETAYVKTWIDYYDGLRTTYGYEVINERNEVALHGTTDHVVVKKDNFRPVSVRRQFPEWHEKYMQAQQGDE
ncbi:acyl-CoA thioester hydrolase [Pelagirhabdus alkalitolerans]|uniref:Acyl-CoA thioester hydrolase n=1 Tax=Pelagirhabdus alkalitolerans TaxID=1612202 RepID=A0A1G6H680_9BACI|nr:thioesterase family protein [Pelagirhabdus alkalitolerans]SDB89790.1 acyl-CoA thioester hydrolase [Pelagirhabdus alkalitolerans]